MAPIIFKGSLNAVGFEQWLNQHLLPSLKNSQCTAAPIIHQLIEKTLLEN